MVTRGNVFGFLRERADSFAIDEELDAVLLAGHLDAGSARRLFEVEVDRHLAAGLHGHALLLGDVPFRCRLDRVNAFVEIDVARRAGALLDAIDVDGELGERLAVDRRSKDRHFAGFGQSEEGDRRPPRARRLRRAKYLLRLPACAER